MTGRLPPGPARREKMLGRGQNISRRDFTDEEWAEMEAETAACKEYRRTHLPTPLPASLGPVRPPNLTEREWRREQLRMIDEERRKVFPEWYWTGPPPA